MLPGPTYFKYLAIWANEAGERLDPNSISELELDMVVDPESNWQDMLEAAAGNPDHPFRRIQSQAQVRIVELAEENNDREGLSPGADTRQAFITSVAGQQLEQILSLIESVAAIRHFRKDKLEGHQWEYDSRILEVVKSDNPELWTWLKQKASQLSEEPNKDMFESIGNRIRYLADI